MKRHRFAIIPFLFGLAFVMVSAAFLVHEVTDHDVDPAWVSAGVCTALGGTALAITLLRRNDEPVAVETSDTATDEV
jgi:hypothetical protein